MLAGRLAERGSVAWTVESSDREKQREKQTDRETDRDVQWRTHVWIGIEAWRGDRERERRKHTRRMAGDLR